MKYLKLTLPTPEENLACDEALLDSCENGDSDEILRFWEPRSYFVVLGYSNRISSDVNLRFCQEEEIPVLRRSSGGGAILQGPGCLNYALILNFRDVKHLGDVVHATNFVMKRQERALQSFFGNDVRFQGISDLTLAERKFSGNAQHRKRRFLLFHGTFLLSLDLGLLEKALPVPDRQPGYRRDRSHLEFLMNLRVASETVEGALMREWRANEKLTSVPYQRIGELVRQRYSDQQWNAKF